MGAVNIFLGGTGKHIAEDIQDSRVFYKLPIPEPLALDINRSRNKPDLSWSQFVHADVSPAVPALAKSWASHETGPRVGPDQGAGKPGPRTSPEHVLLTEVGSGALKNNFDQGLFALRAHGLAVFSLMFDANANIAGSGPGLAFQNLLKGAIAAQPQNGTAPQINLVTSTAGGTGAGMVVPLALWLRQHYPACGLNLVAVTHSAFRNVLVGAPELIQLAEKGKSGTYALLRELSFLHRPDPTVSFRSRSLPVTHEGLDYCPGRPLFDRAYWFGGRTGDGTSTPRDAFEEASVLVRVLSSDAVDDLAAETGNLPLQPIGAITSIEYPKLRLQRRLVFSVLKEIYQHFQTATPPLPGGVAPLSEIHFLNYVSDATTRPLGAWFHEGKFGPFATDKAGPFDRKTSESLDTKVQSSAGGDAWGTLKLGAERTPHGYEADLIEWRRYCNGLGEDIQIITYNKSNKLTEAVRSNRLDEEREFATWLNHKIFTDLLSGDPLNGMPTSTNNVLSLLTRLYEEASTIHGRVDVNGLLSDATPDQIATQITQQKGYLEVPPEVPVRASSIQRLVAFGAGAVAGAATWFASMSVEDFTVRGVSSEVIAWALALGIFALAFRGALWLQLRSAHLNATLSRRRQHEETKLLRLYKQQDTVWALTFTHELLRGEPQRGTQPKQESLFQEMQAQILSMQQAVLEVAEMYNQFEQSAAGQYAASEKAPAHVKGEVGNCLNTDKKLLTSTELELSKRIRLHSSLTPNHRVQSVQLQLVSVVPQDGAIFTPANADVDDLTKALKKDQTDGAPRRISELERLQEGISGIVNWQLGDNLPEDFVAAMLYCANGGVATARMALATQMIAIANILPREPAVSMPGIAVGPRVKRLYAGNPAIIAEFVAAMNDPIVAPAERSKLAEYHANTTIVPSLGQQVAFLDLWALADGKSWAEHTISTSTDAEEALKTYYGANNALSLGGTARGNCFTVLPELLAATKIENATGIVQPLRAAVCARLLGSDLEIPGPTYAELFYLLRARGHLSISTEGAGAAARRTFALKFENEGTIRLVSQPAAGLPPDKLFGAGRSRVQDFDAFTDFLRYSGTPLLNGKTDGLVTQAPTATVAINDWASASSATIAALQYAVVDAWYQGDVTRDAQAMSDEVEKDYAEMGRSECAEDWRRAMLELVAGTTRTSIRSKLILGQ